MPMDEMMDYESMHEPMLDKRAFFNRLKVHLSYSGLLVLASLIVGTIGFMSTMRLDFLEAFLNASMLLGGMGPVDAPKNSAGKIFSSLYALYAGLVFLVVASFLFAPIFHRVLHRFHIEHEDEK
jgi:hypothetical protein